MYSVSKRPRSSMNGSQRDIIPMAEFVNLIKYLKKRLTLLVGIFILGLGIGYPLSGDIISWFLQANGYLPDDVELIIIQPMEVILLRLRIATQIGFGLVLATLIIDLSWNGKKLINKSNKNENGLYSTKRARNIKAGKIARKNVKTSKAKSGKMKTTIIPKRSCLPSCQKTSGFLLCAIHFVLKVF